MSRSVAPPREVFGASADDVRVARAMAERLKPIAAAGADIEVRLAGSSGKPMRVPASAVDALERLLSAVGERHLEKASELDAWARTPLP
jgi:hypothetical protein